MHGNEWRGNDSKRMCWRKPWTLMRSIAVFDGKLAGWFITSPCQTTLDSTQYSVLGPGQISNEVIRTSGFQTPSAKGKIERVQVKQR